jgi:hypothetical protein
VARPPGTTQFTMTPADLLVPPLVQSEVLSANTDYTVVAIGGTNGWPLELLRLIDTTPAPPPLYGKIRVVHVAPFATPPASTTQVNVVEQTGETINIDLLGLEYREATPYFTLPAGAYNWKVTLPNGDLLLDLPAFNLYNGAQLTLFILGDTIHQPLAGLLVIQVEGQPLLFRYLPIVENTNLN